METPSLKQNILYNVLYQIIIVFIPLITSPYLARKLGVLAIGEYFYINSISSYFVLFGTLGIQTYGNRLIARSKTNNEELEKCFSSLFSLQLLLFLIVSITYLSFFALKETTYHSIYLIQFFSVLAGAIDITWFFQGLENFRLIVIRNAIVKFVAMLLVFMLVKNERDIWVYALIMSLSSLIGQIMIWPNALKRSRIRRVKWSDIIYHFKPVLYLFIPVFAISIFSLMDKIMLGYYASKSELAFYEYSEKIIAIPKSIIAALGTAMIPRISSIVANRENGNENKIIKTTYYCVNIVIIALAFGISGVSSCFSILYWGSEFKRCGILITLLCPAFFFSAIGNVVRTQYFIPHMKDKEFVMAICIGALTNLIGNIILIKPLGAIGACVTTVLAELMIVVIQFIMMKHKIGLTKVFLSSLPYFFIGCAMFFVLKIIENSMTTRITTLLLMIVCGFFFFSVFGFIILKTQHNEEAEIIKTSFKSAIRKRKK